MNLGSQAKFARIATIVVTLAASLACFGSIFLRAKFAESRKQTIQQRKQASPKPSNVGGYVSSDACRACHPGAYSTWHRTYHRTMTQVASPESVKGDFNNQTLEYFGKRFHLERRGDEFWITQEGGTSAKVLQTTGSHHYQVYWVGSGKGNLLHNFPFVYLLEDQRWARRNDVFVMPPEVGDKPEMINPWNDGCIACHATFGQAKVNEQTKSAQTEIAELGIACEACHGPAHDHVEHYSNPLNRYTDRMSNEPAFGITNPATCDSKTSTQICGQCHGVTRELDRKAWSDRGYLYRPGEELEETRIVARHPTKTTQDWHRSSPASFFDKYFWRDGMIRVSGREYNGMLETSCYQNGEMSCLSCHSMHDADPNDQLKADMDSNAACTQCHETIGSDVSAHTHHAAESSGSLCYNCHMPHTTLGLVKAIRSHTIDSPNVDAKLRTGRPQACNLCPLDKTLAWTTEHLHEWFDQPIPSMSEQQRTVSSAILDVLAGDAGQRAITAWHMGWEPAIEVSGNNWMAPFLIERLSDSYPVVRYIADRSLKKLPNFSKFENDFAKPADSDKWRQARALWDEVMSTSELSSTLGKNSLLFDEQGELMESEIRAISARRDDRPVDLLE